MHLSIVIPVWNEASKIVKDIKELCQFSEENPEILEIIVVDDGSTDDTFNQVNSIKNPCPVEIDIIQLPEHKGKGYAIRTGVQQSRGDYIMFMDSGRTIPLTYIGKALEVIENNNLDFVVASRHLKSSRIKRPLIWHRRIMSFIFRFTAKLYFGLPKFITDTQCGFKVFKAKTAHFLFEQSHLNGFLLDLEIILLALKNNLNFKEMPVEWTWDRDSRLSVSQSASSVLREFYELKQRFLNS